MGEALTPDLHIRSFRTDVNHSATHVSTVPCESYIELTDNMHVKCAFCMYKYVCCLI